MYISEKAKWKNTAPEVDGKIHDGLWSVLLLAEMSFVLWLKKIQYILPKEESCQLKQPLQCPRRFLDRLGTGQWTHQTNLRLPSQTLLSKIRRAER